MGPQDMLDLLREEPFEPFTICMSDGTRYNVYHPAFMMVDHSKITLGLPTDQSPDRPVERTVRLALLHVTRIEPIQTKAKPQRRS
jgi:hypothetical protein